MDQENAAAQFNISPRNKIFRLGHRRYAIEKKRKSRLIMQDGRKILDMAQKIRAQIPDAQVSVLISGPLCSKTRQFLTENAIDITQE